MSITIVKGQYRYEFCKIIKGKKYRHTKVLPLGTSKAQAVAYDIKQSAHYFDFHTSGRIPSVLIIDAVEVYVKNHLSTTKDGYRTAQELMRLMPFYEDCFMEDLHHVSIEIDQAYIDLKPATRHHKISYLRAACMYARDQKKLCDANINLSVYLPTVKNNRQLYLTRAEMLQIARLIPDKEIRAVLRIAFYSGMRISEIMRAQPEFQDRDKKKAVFVLHDTKNGEPRHVPVHQRCRVLLKYYPLMWKKRTVQTYIRIAMDEAGFPEHRLHDMRHSCASALVKGGVDLFTVGVILGHKSMESTKRYSHLSVEAQEDALAKMR